MGVTAHETGLDVARSLVRAALDAARADGSAVSAAVVDAGGHLVCFERLDGAEIAGPVLAVDKAFTAVAHRAATADLALLAAPGGPLAGLASAGGGRYVCFAGGLPLWSGGRVVGGVGVSGATAEQDERYAEAASALFSALGGPA